MLDFASVIRQGEKDYTSDFVMVTEDGNCCCFAVADGRETPRAAELAVKSVVDDFEKSGVITKESVSAFFNNADNVLINEDGRLAACMAFMLTDGSVAVWGNIGDCRIYLLREGWLYEITADHSEAYTLYEAGEIRYPKIRRQNKRHNLTRMLGDGFETAPDFSQPEIMRKGDSFLICTDGFWENIHEKQIEKTLKRSKSAQNWLDRMMKIIEKNIHGKKYTRFRDSLSAITVKM